MKPKTGQKESKALKQEPAVTWRDLDQFTHVGELRGKKVVIKIIFRGTVHLSAGFLHAAKDEIGDAQFVVLSYSKTNNAIVFDFEKSSKVPGVIKMSGAQSKVISCAGFFRYYQIDFEQYLGEHTPELVTVSENEDRWTVFLNKQPKEKKEFPEKQRKPQQKTSKRK